MHIAIVSAGGAGMFCGSCMHDNTWARALVSLGAEVTLIPTYTPIRVDEENLSLRDVFFGGINVYLDYRLPFWRRVPRGLTRLLDRPWLLNVVSRFGISNDARDLGALTIAMLEGEAGPEERQVAELVDFISHGIRADVVCFSNALLVGALRGLKEHYRGKVFCLLQGDDVFLDALVEPYRSQALELIHHRALEFDGFLVHSRYYRDFMSEYLNLPVEKFHVIPLGIDLEGHDGRAELRNNPRFTVGYFARICPEKGLSELVDAFRILHARHPQTRLLAGGYLGPQHRAYFEAVKSRAATLGSAFQYIGSPATHLQKVDFLKSLDVLSVPTPYREPKGLYVLESAANGVPSVQPNHGAFPELIESTGGGLLFTPGNAAELAAGLEELMQNHARRLALATEGHANVRSRHDARAMAQATLTLFEELAARGA
jgi:glycosyltransferase involved in cell wall biosynthesis